METTLEEAIELLKVKMEYQQDPIKRVQMAAFLKNHFECFGIKSPVRNETQRKWFSTIKPLGFDHFDIVYHLWALPQREYQYVANDYLKKLPKKKWKKNDYKILEELITTKSWWDSVDGLASNAVGAYFLQFPEKIDKVITRWRNSDNFWLNRTCLIFQLKYKDEVDFELLKDLIKQYQGEKEFFIQKAIGWSLRQYSKFNPEGVREFVKEIDLKGLALREASKHI